MHSKILKSQHHLTNLSTQWKRIVLQTLSKHQNPQKHQKQALHTHKMNNDINIEEEDKALPPLFHYTLTEENLHNDDCPYIFWAMLQIPIPEKPVDPVATMFEHLETFMINMLEADVHFTVFPHNLSKYESMEEMPEPLDDPDLLPNNVNEWLTYFPQAQPWAQGGYTYTLVLLGFR